MTQLELVKHEIVVDFGGMGDSGNTMRRTVVAVSTSYSALVDYCSETYHSEIDEVGCGKQRYYTIQESQIAIVPSKF